MANTTDNPKLATKSLLDTLPDDVSREDLQYLLYVRQQIEDGLQDDLAGRLTVSDEMQRHLMEH